jgi:hypothetical protein
MSVLCSARLQRDEIRQVVQISQSLNAPAIVFHRVSFLCLSQIKSEHIGGASRQGPAAKNGPG